MAASNLLVLSPELLRHVGDWLLPKYERHLAVCCVRLWSVLKYRRVYRVSPLEDDAETRERILEMTDAQVEELCVNTNSGPLVRFLFECVQPRLLRLSLPCIIQPTTEASWEGIRMDAETVHLIAGESEPINHLLQRGLQFSPHVLRLRLDGPVRDMTSLGRLVSLTHLSLHGLMLPVVGLAAVASLTRLCALDLGTRAWMGAHGWVHGSGTLISFLDDLIALVSALDRLHHMRLCISSMTTAAKQVERVVALMAALRRMPSVTSVSVHLSPKNPSVVALLETVAGTLL